MLRSEFVPVQPDRLAWGFAQKVDIEDGARPPETGGQRDRDEVEIARAEVPKPHPYTVCLRNHPSRDPFGPRCPPDSGGRAFSSKSIFCASPQTLRNSELTDRWR